MKRILAALLLIPSIVMGQVTTNPGVTGVVGTGTTGSGSVVLQSSPTLTGTVTLTGTTITGTPTWSSSQAITLSTAAQPNVTSVGTLTSLLTSGVVKITGANPGGLTGPMTLVDNNGGEGRIYLYGADATTRGSLKIYALESDAGNNVERFGIAIDGSASFGSNSLTAGAGGFTTLTASAIASAAGNELLCYNTTGGVITYAATVLGCVPSGLQFKDVAGRIEPRTALKAVLTMKPGYGTFKDTKTFGAEQRVWLFADEVCDVDERLCKRDAQGRPENYDKYGTVAYIVAAMKEQQVQIRRLQREVKQLQKEQYAARQSKIRPAAYVTH